MSRRKRPLTVAEARAMADPQDTEDVRRWSGSQNDLVDFQVNCVVCGAPNKALILRLNIPNCAGAKYLCLDCEDRGWAWFSVLKGDERDGSTGTIIENAEMSTVEEHAIEGSKRAKNQFDYERQAQLNQKLFKTKAFMSSSTQNPIMMYKAIREFPDDQLMLHLRACKSPGDIDECKTWDLWIDKARKPR